MKGVLLGSVISAAALFAWGFVFWGVLPISDAIFSSAPPTLVQELRALPESGTYSIPGIDLYESNEEEFQRQHEAGPIAMLFVRKEGAMAGSPSTFAKGFVHMFASALLMALVLKMVVGSMRSYLSRFMFTLVAGTAGAVMSDLGPIIWWLHPAGMHLAEFAYHVVGWGLMGLILARFIKPRAF